MNDVPLPRPLSLPRRQADAVLLDAALAASVAGVVAAAMAVNLGGSRQPDVFAYLFAGGLGALMLVRRNAPVLTLLATAIGLLGYYVAGYPSVGLALPVAAALYSAAEAGYLRWAVGTAFGLLVVSTTARLLEGQDVAYLFGYELATTLTVMAAAMALGDAMRARRRLLDDQAERLLQVADRKEREAAARIEQERLRIARDLHDVLAHTVSVISIHADVATEALADDKDATADALHHIHTASTGAARELRATVGLLRGDGTERQVRPTGSLAQLPDLAHQVQGNGLEVGLRIADGCPELPVAIDTTVYRIVQEALTNTVRHANASRADVTVDHRAGSVFVEVTDDGRGAVADIDGHGLAGMRERAALLGGSVRAGNRQEGGFQVRAELPVRRT